MSISTTFCFLRKPRFNRSPFPWRDFTASHLTKFAILLIILAATRVPAAAQAKPPNDAEIKKRMVNLVENRKKAPGVAVGLIDEKGARVFGAGVCETNGTNSVNGDTIFEIGSITKAFTGILLQDMVDKGELKLEDPISKFLPDSVKTPSRNGKEITLLDLATQSSGLPRLPDNLSLLKAASDNPYADYGPELMYKFLSGYKLKRDIGEKYEYSNLGVGLLGHILELKAGKGFEALVIERICSPLKMDSTRITLSPALKAQLAPGHNASGKSVGNWDFKALAGAGAIRSSMNDMLRFLSANMSATNTSLSATLERSQKPRRDADAGRRIGLCWHINPDGVIWHNGGTGGYRSFMGFNKKSGRGVIVLANSAGAETDGLGMGILGPTGEHKETKLDAKLFDSYVGKYKLAPGAIMTISRDMERFFVQLTGQEKIEIFPEAETKFFCKVVDAQISFVKDAAGKVSHLILHQNGADQKAPRQ